MSKYIDADELMEIFKILKWDASCSIVEDMPTANVVERKELILDGEKCICHFAEIDGHKNIVFKLDCAVTDITNVRIRLDKYNLQEIVYGEWKQHDQGEFAPTYYCSNCEELAEINLYGEYVFSQYCPHCGAKMDEREEEQ